jgi:hypothetical protein
MNIQTAAMINVFMHDIKFPDPFVTVFPCFDISQPR